MGAKILIIDDDVDIVEGEKILLEGNGYTVFTAFDGEEGLRKIRDEVPDLVILDIIMASPTEGFELTRQIKRDERLASIPILMVTSVRRDDETRRHLVNGILPHVEDYIEKPVRPEQILQSVRRVLERREGKPAGK